MMKVEVCVVDTTGLAHPRGKDSLLPICHLLINTETRVPSEVATGKVSVCVCVCVCVCDVISENMWKELN